MATETLTIELKSDSNIVAGASEDPYEHYFFVWYVINNREGKSGFNCQSRWVRDFNPGDKVIASTPEELVEWIRSHKNDGDKAVFYNDESCVYRLSMTTWETGTIFRRVTQEELNTLNRYSTSKIITTRDFDYGTTLSKSEEEINNYKSDNPYEHYYAVWYVINNGGGKSGFNCFPIRISDFSPGNRILASTPEELVKWARSHGKDGDKIVFINNESCNNDLQLMQGIRFRRVTKEELIALNRYSTSQPFAIYEFDYGTTMTPITRRP